MPRFADDLFQLKPEQAGIEAARFGINTTFGAAGLFDDLYGAVQDAYIESRRHQIAADTAEEAR